MPEFSVEMEQRRQQVEDFLQAQFREDVAHRVLLEAMRYSLLAGGKRIRPVLVLSFCEACGGDMKNALPAACSLEMLHTYSLIHDDLPCMDDDDYRRGRLTCHKVYGEDVATLAGDALLTAAFRYLSELEVPAERALRCVAILSGAAGENGMVAGQVLDMEGERRALSEAELRNVHRHKTGDLIRAACQMGAVLGGGSEAQIAAAGEFALHLGLAFQIRDDMLDCVGSEAELGKPIGSDAQNGKSTFVTLFGLERCQTMVERETELALDALRGAGFIRTDFIENLSYSMVSRRK